MGVHRPCVARLSKELSPKVALQKVLRLRAFDKGFSLAAFRKVVISLPVPSLQHVWQAPLAFPSVLEFDSSARP